MMPQNSSPKARGSLKSVREESQSHGKLPRRIGILGLGLIGGTLAKTIHRIHPEISLVACEPEQQRLTAALEEGVISQGFRSLSNGSSGALAAFSACRYIFLCTPVQQNEDFLEKLAPILKESCVLTDTGSVKASIHRAITRRGLSSCFIGGHPMVGSEKSGYENATAYLLENAYFIITREEEMSPDTVEEYRDFIGSLGCIPLLMNPKEHDFATAAVSHLPHILASSLVNLVKQLDNAEEHMKSIAAGGFKDITRIASSSPQMWQQILRANREQILTLLSHYMDALKEVQKTLMADDAGKILTFFQNAKDYRDSLPIRRSGPLPCIFEIYCDLIDEAGGIATIAAILAANAISIKNIGIIHNREFEQGVLRIEFYDEASLTQAVLLLRRHHYTVYER